MSHWIPREISHSIQHLIIIICCFHLPCISAGRATCRALPKFGFCQFSVTLHFLIANKITLVLGELKIFVGEYTKIIFLQRYENQLVFLFLENFSQSRNPNKNKEISPKHLFTSENQS